MTLMISLLALSLVLAPVPSNLSPEAGALNEKAMEFYDAGQLAPAVDQFLAAYQSMPNARRDRIGREQLLGSMRSTLLALHAETGAAAPLCRLNALLHDHADALTAAFPEDPNMLEIRNARARGEEVTKQLAVYGPGACPAVPTPTPVAAPAPVVPAATPPAPVAKPQPVTTTPPGLDGHPVARKQIIAGVAVLPLGIAALAVLGLTAGRFRLDLRDADALHTEVAGRPYTTNDQSRMSDLHGTLRRERGLMIAMGLAGVAMVAAGTALLVRGSKQRRRAHLGVDLQHHRFGLTLAGEF